MSAIATSRRIRRAAPIVLVVALGAALSACGSSSSSASSTTTTTSGSSGSVASQVASLTSLSQNAKSASFQAVYTLTESGKTSTITLSQTPPKYLFKTSDGVLLLDDGTNAYYCGSDKKCLQMSGSNPLAAELSLFNGTTFQSVARGYAVASSVLSMLHVDVSFSNATYGGQSSQCMKITYTKTSTSATYCVSSTGVLTYWSAGTTTFTLTSFSSSPPSSDYVLPSGYTAVTVPSVG